MQTLFSKEQAAGAAEKRGVAAWIAARQDTTLARNTAWMFAGTTVRLLLRACYFLLLPRTLGPTGYGAFVGVVSLVAIVSPFSTLGSGNLLVKNVSRDESLFPVYWGNALLMSVVSSAVLIIATWLAAVHFLPAAVSTLLILCVAVADIFFSRLAETCAQAFQAFENLKWTAHLFVLSNFTKLVAAVMLALFIRGPNATIWAILYMGAAAVCCFIGVSLVISRYGRPRVDIARMRGEVKEGFLFSVSLSGDTINNDIDKTMLATLATLDIAGIYAAAYRVLDVAFAPVMALLSAAYPRFFRHGSRELRSSSRYGTKLICVSAVYSITASAALWFGADLIPMLLGSEYAKSVEALKLLAIIPVLKTFHRFLAHSLTGAGHQGARTVAQIAIAFFNVALNLVLIPLYSWRGAAWASLTCDGLLVVVFLTLVLWLSHRERKAERENVAIGAKLTVDSA